MFIILDTTKDPYEAFVFLSFVAAEDFAQQKMKEEGRKDLTIGQYIEYWKYQVEGK